MGGNRMSVRDKRRIAIVVSVATALTAGIIAVTNRPPKKDDAQRIRVLGEVGFQRVVKGHVVEHESAYNRLVANGIRLLFGLVTGDSSSYYDTSSFICLGEDSSYTDTAMTSLQGDSLTWSPVDSITRSANYIQWWATFAGTVAHTVREIALFNDSGATMLDRAQVSWGAFDSTDTITAWVKLRVE